jgi:hypothetical protein
MEPDDDYFRQRAVNLLLSELPPDRQEKFWAWAEGKPLSIQLDALVISAMKEYREPEFLRGRG